MPPVPPPDHPSARGNPADSRAERVSAGQTALFPLLQRLAGLLADSPHNLVSNAERSQVLERHVLESASVADALVPTGRWMDLGTGGGLPGLVLAARHPDVAWTLVDATAKKIAAVRSFAAELGLTNVTPMQGRAETLARDPEHRGQYDGVVARAVAPLVTLTELARGFLAQDGLLVAIKGPAWQEELDAAARALTLLRLEHVHSVPVDSEGRAS